MASNRQFPLNSPLPPPSNQNSVPQPPPLQTQSPQRHGNQCSQNWGYPISKYHHGGYGSSSQHYGGPFMTQQPPPPPPPPPHHHHHHHQQQQQQQYPYPPPLDYTYPPPPLPPASMLLPLQAPMCNASSQYSQLGHQPMQPPPPPSLSSSSLIPPPPPPPPSIPPDGQGKKVCSDGGSHGHDKGLPKGSRGTGRWDREHSNKGSSGKQQKPLVPPVPIGKSNEPSGRVETEEERRLRKESEKHRQEQKRRQMLKEAQKMVLQKTQMLSSGKAHGSILGSRIGERGATPILGGDSIENRLRKPTTFVGKLK